MCYFIRTSGGDGAPVGRWGIGRIGPFTTGVSSSFTISRVNSHFHQQGLLRGGQIQIRCLAAWCLTLMLKTWPLTADHDFRWFQPFQPSVDGWNRFKAMYFMENGHVSESWQDITRQLAGRLVWGLHCQTKTVNASRLVFEPRTLSTPGEAADARLFLGLAFTCFHFSKRWCIANEKYCAESLPVNVLWCFVFFGGLTGRYPNFKLVLPEDAHITRKSCQAPESPHAVHQQMAQDALQGQAECPSSISRKMDGHGSFEMFWVKDILKAEDR